MPSLLDFQEEKQIPTSIKNYIGEYGDYSDRNVIVYYSGWLSSPRHFDDGINDMDKNGFMAMCEGLDLNRGLDLILHTPGGSVAATESIIDYLNTTFDGDVRAIVPQLAMSGGTMVACSSKEILMGKQSSLGPVDPQLEGFPAQGVVSEFERMKDEIIKNPASVPVWSPIISKINPSFLDSCYKSIEWANEILETSLKNNMFKDNPCDEHITKIVNTLGSSDYTKHHSRHLSAKKCKDLGLNITMMENDEKGEDLILSIHHACMTMFNTSPVIKIFANNKRDFLGFSFS